MGDSRITTTDAIGPGPWEKVISRAFQEVLTLTGQELMDAFEAGRKAKAEGLPVIEIVDKQAEARREQSLTEIVTRMRQEKDAINRANASYDPRQVNVSRLLDTVLKAQGLDKAGWEIFPTQIHSPADKVGADYLLVNTKTGEFHILDATSNPNKDAPLIRKEGVVSFENRWFDQSGALRVHDIPEAREFQKKLGEQLVDLTGSKSLLRLGVTPFPQSTDTSLGTAKSQVDSLIDWLKREAKSTDRGGYDHTLLTDYALRLENGASKFLDISFKERGDPVFDRKAKESAKSAVVDYVLEQINKTAGTNGSPESSDVYLNQGRVKLRTGQGEYIDGGEALKLIEAARAELLGLDPSRVKSNAERAKVALANAKTDAARETATAELEKARTEEKILKRLDKAGLTPKRFVDLLIQYRNEITNGGQVGNGRAAIVENLVRILRARSEDLLLGRTPKQAQTSGPEKGAGGSDPRPSERLEPMLKEGRNIWKASFDPSHLNGQYSMDVHLALTEINKDASWSEADWKDFTELVDRYGKQDPAAIERVHRMFETGPEAGNGSGSTAKPPATSDRKPLERVESIRKQERSVSGNGKPVSVEETSEFYDSQDTTARDRQVLKTETRKGANGVEIVTDAAGRAEVAKTLEKYNKDEVFERFLEKKTAEAKDENERRKLQEELDNYRRMSPAERTQVRDAVVGQIAERARSGGRAGSVAGRVLSVGGTVVAVGMLVDMLAGEVHAGQGSEARTANPQFRQ